MKENEINFKVYKNYYLFYVAKYNNEAEFLKEIYLQNYLINQKNSLGETLAHLLAYEGMTEKYYPFLIAGGEEILTNDGNSVLHYCVSSGTDIFLMIDLINKGVDPLLTNKYGQTAIHLTSTLQSASYFINWNFRTLSKIDKLFDIERNSIAHTAALNKNKAVMDYYLNEYPNLRTVKNKMGYTPEQIYYLLMHPFMYQIDNNSVDFKKCFETLDSLTLLINKEVVSVKLGEIKFKLQRNNFTNIEKVKPMGVQVLKYEAKELFKDSSIVLNSIESEIYKDIVRQREEIKEHDFGLDMSSVIDKHLF